MSAQIIDGAAVSARVRRGRRGRGRADAAGGPSQASRRCSWAATPRRRCTCAARTQAAEAGMQLVPHRASREHAAGGARRSDRAPQRRSGRARDPRAEPAAGWPRRGARVRRHRPRQGRRRLPPGASGRLVARTPRPALLHAGGRDELLDAIRASARGREAVVIGRSNIVGKPIAMLLLAGATARSRSRTRARAICAAARAAPMSSSPPSAARAS